ncbi:phosphotransferase family protein [Aspergillus brunneoviolaceus CBS 621.78]|uniref:Phosphotransferase family protein n=1 Tax=Aspergillus brunneoviolaceus CBS 621.78 TaxID=1450534 RepID=A0ACD1GGD3_9EURO|nr:phosphotransferase family protein [Aspergillus brunneoviolaceus CBS 621.78]RAH48297.1 phosphotransferase family protein [Aspergillus brunneoviolaceus CBS 621.78]
MPIISRMLNGIRSISPGLSRETTLLPISSRRRYSYQHPQLRMANIVGDPYTSGRWVWDERQQLQERYREFDILEMQKVAMDSSSSGSCVRMAKIGEGSYNKSFKLTMGNGKTVVARVPNPNAGPAFLTTASEVATMDFLRTILGLPVPKVLAWNSAVDSTNRVGAEYIIMEYTPGKNLADVWTDMDLECKVRTMEDIVTTQHKSLSLKFSEYGCLFYRKDAPPGSHPARVEGGNLSHELKQKIAERFSIGPTVDTAFWRKGRGDMDIYRGPWASAVDYIQASALREIAWSQKHATPRSPNDPSFVSHSQNDPAEHVSLLQRYLSTTPHLIPQEEGILGSFLWHPGLCTPNIFVDDSGHITSIIDWQSASAGPLFLEGRHPHFLDYKGDLILELPEDFKQLDANTQSAVQGTVINSILLGLYEKYTAERNPLLSRVFQYPNGKTLTDPIRFVGNTWAADIIPLRESLIRIQKKWRSPLGHVECPIDFSPEEIRRHYEDSESWNEVQDFWDGLSGIMSRDGWTSHATYDQAMSIYSQIHAETTPPSSHNV